MFMLFVQLIGFFGTAFAVLSFQCKHPRRLFLVQLCGCLFYFIQFLLLGAYTGAASNLVGITKSIFLIRKWNWMRWKGWAVLICAAQIALTILTWQSFLSLLPCIANIVSLITCWGGNAKDIRLFNLTVCSPCWMVYDFFAGSVAGVVCEVFVQLSTLLSIHRYGWKALAQEKAA